MTNAGLYLRLSADEMENGEKLKNQEVLLKESLCNLADLKITKIYRDNGYSGTSFDRPGWQMLMEDIKNGQINCIVVKDLSRLGRNYIETGNYLELIFPFMGVRFISVNDSYDSANPSGDFEPILISLKNLSNECYAKDISRKIFSAKEMQRQKGLFYGNIAPFGYWKEEANPHHLIINPETAPIVRDMFLWKLEGMYNSQIANRLNEQNIPAPMKYLYECGIVSSKRFANNVWQVITIQVLLSNRTYTGDLTQGKKRRYLAENQAKVRKLPKDEWIVVKNTHEPIISRELFAKVQSICEQEQQENRKYRNRHSQYINPENTFADLIYSKTSGLKMYRTRNYCQECGMQYRFTTISKRDCAGNSFPIVSIKEELIRSSVICALKRQTELFLDMNKILQKEQRNQKCPQEAADKYLEEHFCQIKNMRLVLSSLYSNYADGLLTAAQFKEQKRKYSDQLKKLEREAKQVTPKDILHAKAYSAFEQACLEFYRHSLLTRTLALALIKRIDIYNSRQLEVTFQFQDEIKFILCHIGEEDLCRN